jgi:hypothetical protein
MNMLPKEIRAWLKALGIAKILFEYEGYHCLYLEAMEDFIRRKAMYSPKISEDLIPRIFRVARTLGMPMTGLVNRILEKAFDELHGLEAESAVSEDDALTFQKGLERALNGLQEEVKSSWTAEGKKATITGAFKVSISRRGKAKYRIVAGDPDRPGSLASPMLPKD